MNLRYCINFLLHISVFSCVFLTPGIFGSFQQITFFEGHNCNDGSTGKSEVITETKNNLNSTWISNASSMHIVGLWKVFQEETSQHGSHIYQSTVHYNSLPPAGRCVNVFNFLNKYYITKVLRLSSSDMTTPELVFYTERNYNGENYTVNEITPNLPKGPIRALSYVHLSNQAWTIYPYENFTGNPVYLRPMDPYKNYEGKTIPSDHYSFDESATLIVGSVRKGDSSVVTPNAFSIAVIVTGTLYFLGIQGQ